MARILLSLFVLFWFPVFSAEAANKEHTSDIRELRGLWITRFEWPDRDPEACRERIRRVMARAAQSGFNAVFFQVRGQADALYPSPYEPWSPLLGSRDPGFDPLEFALVQARRFDLQFHAYVNAFPLWQGEKPPPHTSPEHLYWTHGPGAGKASWVCRDKEGKAIVRDRYLYLSPAVPEVQDHIRKVVVDIVKRYDVDGIHLDRIRYPAPESSYDRFSLSRFKGDGNPRGLNREDWQRDQVNRLVSNLYGAIQAEKPHVVLSAAVWGIYNNRTIEGYSRFSSGYHDFYQDSRAWLKMGVMDAIAPMIYWDMANPTPNYDDLLLDFLGESYGRHVWGGYKASYKSFDEIEKQIFFTRKSGGVGTVAFASSHLDQNNYWPRYKENLFRRSAAVPLMEWKREGERSAIIGHVLDTKGRPIVDAVVRIEPDPEVWLTTAEGFFVCPNIPHGEHTLIVSLKGRGVIRRRVSLIPPKPAMVSIILKTK